MSSSDITIIPERFCGLRVLLVEDDIMLLLDHANQLQKSSYEVTVATEASAALSIIKNGETLDCLLIDGDLCQEDMEPFLRQVWSHQSQLSIIVMAAYDTHLRIPKESKESGAVLSLLRPRCYTDICNIWKHICRNKISTEVNVSEENLHKEDQIDRNVPRVDPRVEPSAINGSTAINNNIFLEHGVSFEDFFLEDNGGGGGDAGDQEDVVEIIRKENTGIGAARKEDNGKKPLIPKRKCDKPVEDDEHPTKMGAPKVRIRWKGELEDKFQNALKELGVNATSNEIRNYMNVPGLTRHHVASHQQKYRSKRRNLEANIAELAKKGTTFQVVGIANKRSRHSIQPKENAPVIESSGILRLPEGNYKGILYMLVENIRAILLQRDTPSLPVPQPTTTPNNYYGGDRAIFHSSRGKGIEIQQTGQVYRNVMVTGDSSSHPAFGEAMAPPKAPLGGTAYCFGNPAIAHGSSRKGIEIQPMGQVYGNEMVAGGSSSHPAFGEAMAPLGGTARSFGDPAIVRSSSGGKGIVIQPMGQVYGNVMVTGESSPQHAFGEAMTPLGGTAHSFGDPATVHSSSGDGKGIETQPMGQVYGNAMMAGESSSQHAFGEAMAPLGGHQTTTAHSFGVVGNSNFGGQGTGIQMMEPDYGNAVMDPMVAGEASPHHAFGEAMAPIDVDNYGGDQETIHSIGVVENSNSGGQGTGIQLMEHNYKNELDAMATCETSLHHAFGDAVTPFGGDQASAHSFGVVENPNSGGQGTYEFRDAIEPRVSGKISSPRAFGEEMAPLGVGATVASDNDLGYNRLQNGVDNGILGDSSGSRSNEVQVQFPCFEPEPECVADFGGNNVNVNHNLEAVNSPDVFSFDARELYPSQDVQVNIEDLDLAPDSPPLVTFLDLENNKNSGSNLDSMPSGPASADLSIPEIPTEENDNPAQSELPGNSIFPVNSDAGFMDNLPCDSDLENLMNFLEGNDGNLFDESFYR